MVAGARAQPHKSSKATPPYQFVGEMPQTSVSILYRLAVVLTALMMIILPLLYIGLIAAAAWAMYYHARYDTWILAANRHDTSRVQFLKFVAYVGPLLAGVILLLFMIKPLVARPREEEQPLTLDRSQEPLLYALIDELCERIGATTPSQIVVDCDINASASFRGSVLGIIRRDLVLTIGLPLAAGLTKRQFVGVMAHEFGHFTQGSGMFASYVVRRIALWFARIAYERDSWDYWLHTMSSYQVAAIAIISLMARACVFLTRKILGLFATAAAPISAALLRQMEFHADAFEAAVVGDGAFVETVRDLHRLGKGWAGTRDYLREALETRRLPENLPSFNVHRLPDALDDAAFERLLEREKIEHGLFSSHPSDIARVRAVRARPSPGIFVGEGPATALFSNFKMIAHAVTLNYYREGLELDVGASDLVPVEEAVVTADSRRDEQSALAQYMRGMLTPRRPLTLGITSIDAPANPKEAAAKLRAIAAKLAPAYPKFQATLKRYQNVDTGLTRLQQADALLRAGFRHLDRKWLEIQDVSAAGVAAALEAQRSQDSTAASALSECEKWLRARLVLALQLAKVPAVQARLQGGAARLERADRIVATLALLAPTWPLCLAVWKDALLLEVLVGKVAESSDPVMPRADAAIRTTCERIRHALEQVRALLSDAAYPLEHHQESPSLTAHLFPNGVRATIPASVYRQSMEYVERVMDLYLRLLGRLLAIARDVEVILKVPAPQIPAADDEDADAPKSGASAR